ncbi:MAG: hypothetical protein IRZ28_12685 [Steroidobacteraceae bacterium]|nr:hypothetical protein [Steroidobacteraceae bacterium]
MSPPDTHIDHVTPYDRFAWSDSVVEHLLATGHHQRELAAYFGEHEYEALVRLAREAEGARPLPDAPRVFIVPGIMGSQLGLRRPEPLPNDVLWIDPVDISHGNLRLLRLPSEVPIVSLGVVLFTYLRLKLHLRIAGFDPLFHDYDWRLGIDTLGKQFAERLAAERGRVMIVAHSMGALVSRAALACPRTAHIERVVLLGAPNSGSYAPLQALRGVYAVVRKLARLASPEQSAEALASDVFSTFPSLYHLLPPAGFDDALNVLDINAWPSSGPQPDAALLASAQDLVTRLAPGDERFVNVIGVGQETVTRVRKRRNEFEYTITRQGDGTVPVACAALPGARAYYTKVAHTDLARATEVAHAVAEVLRTGETNRLETSCTGRSRAEARITERELRRTHTEKVDWVHMEPDARQIFLRNLNEPPQFKLRVPVKKATATRAAGARANRNSRSASATRRATNKRKPARKK